MVIFFLLPARTGCECCYLCSFHLLTGTGCECPLHQTPDPYYFPNLPLSNAQRNMGTVPLLIAGQEQLACPHSVMAKKRKKYTHHMPERSSPFHGNILAKECNLLHMKQKPTPHTKERNPAKHKNSKKDLAKSFFVFGASTEHCGRGVC